MELTIAKSLAPKCADKWVKRRVVRVFAVLVNKHVLVSLDER